MKTRIILASTMIGGLFLSFSSLAQHRIEKIWETEPVLEFSEGVVPDPSGKFLFVSNTIGNPMAKDGIGTISKVGFDGKIMDLAWVEGLNAPKDIQIFGNKIYVADLDEVIVVDIAKGEISERILIDGARLLHNIAFDDKGGVFVSDMFTGKIHLIQNGQISTYVENMQAAAGLYWEKGDLYVLTGAFQGPDAGKLSKVSPDKSVTVIASGMDGRMNGLQKVKEGEFLASNWGGVLYYINADGTVETLRDTRDQNIPAGILYYNPKTEILYISSDQHNILYAFKLID